MDLRVKPAGDDAGRARADSNWSGTALALPARALLLLFPLQKFAEQRVALFRFYVDITLVFQKGREVGGGRGLLRIDTVGLAKPLQHFFGYAPAGPTRHCRRQIDVTPFRMSWWLLELFKVSEERFDESLHLAVTISVLLPVEHRKHGRHRDRVGHLAWWNERRIFLARKLAQRVVILVGLGERDWHQVESRIGWNFREKIDRLADNANERRDFSCFELLEGERIIEQRRFDLNARALKHDRPGQAGRAACRSEIDLLALQISKTVDIGARQNVHFRYRQTDDVIDAVFEIDGFALRAEVLEHVRLSHRHINPAQIEEIVEVRGGPIGDHRNNAQIVAVIEDLGQLIGKCHVAAGQQATGHSD